MNTEAAKSEESNQLTEANLALIQAERKQENRKQQHKHSNHDEDDRSSVLSKIDSNNQEDLNLSEYCLSSDAETEKMDEDVIKQQDENHIRLSELAKESVSSPNDQTFIADEPQSPAHDEDETADDKHEVKNLVNDKEESSEGSLESLGESIHEDESPDQKSPAVHSPLQESTEEDNERNNATDVTGEAESSNNEHIKDEKVPMDEGKPINELESQGVKRPVDERDEDSGSHFKKPKLPTNGSQDNDEDNDADEDEDEADDDDHDKQELSGTLNKTVRKYTTSPTSAEQSPMEQEQLRLEALKAITDIERQFAELRQQLYENKLAKLQAEAQMCLEGSHPALQSYYQKIDSVRDYKLHRAYQRQKYELECIDKETRATRCFIHQDFFRKVTDLKHELLSNTTQKWYDINKERREMDVIVPEINYHVPVKISGKTLSCITGYAAPAQQRREGELLPEDLACEGINFRFRNNPVDKLEVIVDRMRFNNQLSDLQGLKTYFGGFPGAPTLSGLKDSEIYEDLQKLQSKL